MSVLLTVHERLQLQRVVDAEQQRGRRAARPAACDSASAPDAEADAEEGQHSQQGCAGEDAGGGKRRNARSGASKGGARGKGRQARQGTAAVAEGGSSGTKRSAGHSMGSRLRNQLHALTQEPQ